MHMFIVVYPLQLQQRWEVRHYRGHCHDQRAATPDGAYGVSVFGRHSPTHLPGVAGLCTARHPRSTQEGHQKEKRCHQSVGICKINYTSCYKALHLPGLRPIFVPIPKTKLCLLSQSITKIFPILFLVKVWRMGWNCVGLVIFSQLCSNCGKS